MMYKLEELVKRRSWTISDKRACVAELLNSELIPVWSVTFAALYENEGTVIEKICSVRDSFLIEVSSGALGPSAEG